jgi:hypothetical protein
MSQKLKLSRRDRMRRNPIPWITLIIFSGFLFYTTLPVFSQWKEYKKQIKTLEGDSTNSIQNLEQKVVFKNNELKQVQAEFDEKSEKHRKQSMQLFPKKLDTTKIVRILELYTLGLGRTNHSYDQTYGIELTNINFGTTKENKEKKRHETTVSIGLNTTLKNLKIFIEFLQRGEMDPEIAAKINSEQDNKGLLDYFENKYYLPIAHIQSIKITKNKEGRKSNNIKQQTTLQVIFFSK